MAGLLILGAAAMAVAPFLMPRAHAAAVGSYVELQNSSTVYTNTVGITSDGVGAWTVNHDGSVVQWNKYAIPTKFSSSTVTGMTGVTASGTAILYAGGNIWVGEEIVGTSTDGYLFELNASGTRIASVNLGAHIPNALTYDGSNIWTANNDGTVSEVSSSGSLVATATSSLSQAFTIAYDGTHLWVAGQGSVIDEMNTSGGIVATTTIPGITSSTVMKASAMGSSHVWIAYYDSSNSTGGLARFATSSGALTSTTTAPSYIADGISLAFDGTNMWAQNWGSGVSSITPTGTITNYPINTTGPITFATSTKVVWAIVYTGVYVVRTTSTLSSNTSIANIQAAPSSTYVAASNALLVPFGTSDPGITVTTNDTADGIFINSGLSPGGTETTSGGAAVNVPVTVGPSSSYISVTVYAEDYTSQTYNFNVYQTPSADATLQFTSSADSVSCATYGTVCSLYATSTALAIPYSFTPTLAVSGGSLTINSSSWTSGQQYASTTTGNPALTINVTGADGSTSTYSLDVTTNHPYPTGGITYYPTSAPGPFGFATFGPGISTMNGNLWYDDGNGNEIEVSATGTYMQVLPVPGAAGGARWRPGNGS